MTKKEKPSGRETEKPNFFYLMFVGAGLQIIASVKLSEEEMKMAYAGLGEDYIEAYKDDKPYALPHRHFESELQQTEDAGFQIPEKLNEFTRNLKKTAGFFLVTLNQPPESIERKSLDEALKSVLEYHASLTL
ncbi:MAG: hypothetical protein AAB675_01110 [Patescibacteria group bacterium]